VRTTATVEGRVGNDPEIKFSKNGTAWLKMNVAVTERVKGDGGEWEDGNTTWYSVTCWKSLAEQVAENIRKGDLVVVVGAVKMETWESDSGPRSQIAISADSVGLVRKGKSREEAPF
jgi:single-strand DNA-binding protein